MGVHQIDLTPAIKKNLLNIFLENKRSYPAVNPNESNLSFLNNEEVNSDAHIKHFNEIIPSIKHGDRDRTTSSKNFIFHNNPNFQDDINSHMKRNNDEEICLIKYKDRGYELINEKDLKKLLKSLLSLQNVEFVQSYIKPSDQDDQIF